MIIGIHQPNYLPWIGFFYKMANTDIFVLLDDVQHSKKSVTNRNFLKTHNGSYLLTVPIKNKEKNINELIIADPDKTLNKHWNIIYQNYNKSKGWNYLSSELEFIYTTKFEKLIDLNMELIKLIKSKLNIKTKLVTASNLSDIENCGNERNLSICHKLKANVYLSGIGAKSYNNEESYRKHNISLEYTNFIDPVYPQLWGEFIPKLSIIDLIFNCGRNAIQYI